MAKYQKQLPEKYYLSHFKEFIHYIDGVCPHLLEDSHKDFIKRFHQLSGNGQCMLVRVLNRRSQFIHKIKMCYTEIDDCPQQLLVLKQQGFLTSVSADDIELWLNALTKVQLLALVTEENISSVKKSASKADVLKQVLAHCDVNACLSSGLANEYLVKTFEHCIRYLLFLFFGHLNSGLDQFSMRDMGILKTRGKDTACSARFDNKQQSLSAFYYVQRKQQFENQMFEPKSIPAAQAHPVAIGSHAQTLRDKYFYALGKALLLDRHQLGLDYLRASQHPKAQEKWLREEYKLGNKEKVKQGLDNIIANCLDDGLVLFAEDFYQRKFQQVKVGKLTEKLRNDSYSLLLDEMHRDRVESGVKDHYQRHGVQAFRTENQLFNSLFALTFWYELFIDTKHAVVTEFDRRSRLTKENTLYEELAEVVEQRLTLFNSPQKAIVYLTKNATEFYGQPNGLFHWHAKLMDALTVLIEQASPLSVISHLRAMAKNYQGLSDGYPDLMLVDNGVLKLVEVKAQGDSIRPNQFVTINALQAAGFIVQICRVEWIVDPMQPYVVVDIETTGGKQTNHRITEIGAVKIINGEVVDSWTTLLNPQRHISQFITRLTGITNEMVQDAPLFCEVLDDFLAFAQGCIFVAHNVNFDYGFIKQECQRIDRHFSMPKLCTVRETRKYFPGLTSYSLANLCTHFDISLESHHRALCDAQAAAEILSHVQSQKNTIQKS